MSTVPSIRAQEIHSQVRRVQRLSRFARGCCTCALVLVGVIAFVVLFSILWPTLADEDMKFRFLGFRIKLQELTQFDTKIAAAALLSIFVLISGGALLHLRGLFDNFTRAAIYTQSNVRHLRVLGWLALLGATLSFLQPVIVFFLIRTGVLDGSMIDPRMSLGSEKLSSFAMAGLILLASWIMDVGKNYSDEAEQLRVEAELVV